MAITASEAIETALDNLNDPYGDYHEMPLMIRSLNRSIKEIGDRSRAFVVGIYHQAIEAQGKYGLPERFRSVQFVGIKRRNIYGGRNKWRELDPVSTEFNTYLLENEVPGPPQYYDIEGKSADERIVAPVSQVHNLNSFEIGDLPPTVKIGDMVINATNANAETTITFLNGNIIFVEDWLGNAAPGVAVGNAIRIVSPERANQTLIISPAPNYTDPPGDESIYVFAAMEHRTITDAEIHAENDNLDIDPEFETALIFRLCYHRSIAKRGIAHPETQGFNTSYEGEYYKHYPKVKSRIDDYKRMWFHGTHHSSRYYAYPTFVFAPPPPTNTHPLNEIDIRD